MIRQKPRFLLLEVIDSQREQAAALVGMRELEMLVKTYGGERVAIELQRRDHPHVATYVGPGKVVTLGEQIKQLDIDVVVINGLVNSGQLFRLEKALWPIKHDIKVWDRVDLILNIFSQHAVSTAAKLQIVLAQIDHMGPRMYGLGGTVLSRQGAGIGTKGKGETNIEKERRRSRREKQQIVTKLRAVAGEQRRRMQERKDKGIFVIALVGYTSAGKTSLFNALTKKQKSTNASLFTTLDSIVGRMNPRNGQRPILISDTIGFIRDLPPKLIETFKSTLLESVEAHLLLHVVDASDPEFAAKIVVVEDIIRDLGVTAEPFLVFNKIDLSTKKRIEEIKTLFADRPHVLVSAQTGDNLPALRQQINRYLDAAFPG